MVTEKKIKIAFRVDSSFEIGSGHLMRCLALAESLRERDMESFFICKDFEGNFNSHVKDKGFILHTLNYRGDFNLNEDAENTVSVLRMAGGVEWLVVDSYAIDSKWEKLVRSETRNIMAIDDIANRSHDCDILLDQNYHQDMDNRYDGLLPGQCKTLLGPDYALLRREFSDERKKMAKNGSKLHRILISLGGSDPANATIVALEALLTMNRKDIEVDVVVGSSDRNQKKIKKLCDKQTNLNYHLQAANMAQLMANADLAIGVGGISNWERCCVGLPTIALSTASIQESILNAMAMDGIILYAGKSTEVSPEKLGFTVSALLDDEHQKSYLSRKSMELVDGNGANIVAKNML